MAEEERTIVCPICGTEIPIPKEEPQPSEQPEAPEAHVYE